MDHTEDLIRYGRLCHEHGLVIGAGGNISCREGEHLFIKKKGADMSRASGSDYVRVPFTELEAYLREGGKNKEAFPGLSSEVPLHAACYSQSGDTGAVVHVHPPYTIAVAGKMSSLQDISYEFECILGGEVPVIGYLEPGSLELARAVAGELAKGAGAVMLRKHGAIAVGACLEEAFLRVLALERASITYLNS
ncbi:MAG: hypothetical protein GF409_08435 [Candidatus Omnitrophica bacterium]|nr:hypothetical protein [Candidatus Omnitrophota bacterium]